MQRLQSPGEAVTVHSYSDYRQTVVVPNATAQDSSLSWAARGLLVYMLSMPPKWHFHEHDLVNRSPMGRDHLRSIVRELEAHGYLQRHQRTDAKGRRMGSHWEVWAVPMPIDQGASNPLTGTPSTENPSMDRSQSQPGFYPSTENPSADLTVDGIPVTGNPSTENPSTEKNNKKEKQQTKTLFPLTPPQAAGNPRERGTNPRAKGQNPRAQRENPRAKGTNPRSQKVNPATAPLPECLEQHREAIADFWAAKRTGSARTPRAFELLVGQLEQIHNADPAAVAAQLNAATQAGWSSITFQNWERYGRRESNAPRTGSRQSDNAARVIAGIRAGKRNPFQDAIDQMVGDNNPYAKALAAQKAAQQQPQPVTVELLP